MLMSGAGRLAKVHFGHGTFQLTSNGDHILCAVTGKPIPLEELRYWSVTRQEAYADAAASFEAERRAGLTLPGGP
ncbi:MAG: DUF2093 domain-containing protein [Sphingomonas sp.]|nr:DUF2093 domain-containing protein [Sphingomonas sp.]